jgi:hypothetical protein
VDTKKYGSLKTELNNAYVAGQNNCPKTVESAVTMLSHYMHDKGVHMIDGDKGQTASDGVASMMVSHYSKQEA